MHKFQAHLSTLVLPYACIRPKLIITVAVCSGRFGFGGQFPGLRVPRRWFIPRIRGEVQRSHFRGRGNHASSRGYLYYDCKSLFMPPNQLPKSAPGAVLNGGRNACAKIYSMPSLTSTKYLSITEKEEGFVFRDSKPLQSFFRIRRCAVTDPPRAAANLLPGQLSWAPINRVQPEPGVLTSRKKEIHML